MKVNRAKNGKSKARVNYDTDKQRRKVIWIYSDIYVITNSRVAYYFITPSKVNILVVPKYKKAAVKNE